MNRFYRNSSVVLVLLFSISAFAQKQITYNEKTGAEANAIWPGAEHVWLKQNNIIPAFIQFRNDYEPDEAGFFTVLNKLYHLPAAYGFNVITDEKDQLGWEHKRFQVTYNNLPVNHGIFLLHLVNGKVKKYNGYLFKNISVTTSPGVAESTALNNAFRTINASVYKWEVPGENDFLKRETGDASASYFPKGKLEIYQNGNNESNDFRLAWKFDIYAVEPLSRNYVYVDAQTGEILNKISRIQDANAAGTAVTVYRGAKPIVADSYNGQYRLNETDRGNGIHTYNLHTGTSYGGATEFLDADNYWNNVNASKDQYAGDAHWGAEMTYDFYASFGRNSIDNAGFALNLYVHYSSNYLNAFWDGQEMNFGDGSTGYNPLTSLDITGHEISHGLDQYTANLTYQNESGALNESFSDIFGTAVEWFADSTRGNWLIGEDIGSAFRSMANPKTYGDPDTYTGTNWYTGTADNGGVHTNSNVQNHWDYLLATGGSGTNDLGNAYNVTGITRHKATQIAWRNMVYYLTDAATYADSRFYSIQAATDLFGTCSQEVISTTKAWYAVGVGADFTYGVDAQFTASPTSGCTTPTVVTFNNTSTNASSYTWDFGDGSTSAAQSPTHTYNAFGTYTVRLVSNGGSCGIDSLIRSNYISISVSNPCVVIMPTTGSYQTQTSCTGTIYDNGGPSGNYSDMTNSTVTIAPTGASKVKLHFTQFAMENTYDFLYVYDGPSITSPIIGTFTGTTIPADVTSSGSSITIRQSSDQYVNDVGYTIQWTCIAPNTAPSASFKADVTQTCTGTVNFTDLSTGGATSWLWNFGDGATSTVQNPTHQYTANGTFTVSLTATNSFGSNTSTRNNYITVTKPASPTAANGSNCGPQAFSLSASTTNPVTWYDSNGVKLSAANPFVTPVLNNTTTYWVEDTAPQPVFHVGPADNTIGAGGDFTSALRAERFTVSKHCTLQSVYIYAQGSGYRTIQYRDTAGGVIAQRTINCPNGGSRITLNFDLIPGGPYELGVRDTCDFYRNTSGAVYPYNDGNGMVSIIGNNAGGTATAYYYFFYDWQIKEQDCISLRQAVTARVNPALSVTNGSVTNVACNGGSNGSATVNASGGTPSFTYNWSNSQTSATAGNLSAGTYTVTVTDNAGCSGTTSQTITQPAALTTSATATNITCHGNSNGAVNLNVNGGTTNYSYLWTGGATTQNLSGLAAGTYSVVVTDAHSCTSTASVTITEPAALSLSANAVNVTCNGSNNGTISLSVSGGTPSYAYNWGGGVVSQNRTGLGAGTYTVTVTDASNCTSTISQTISEPTALNLSTTSSNASCGNANGSASVTVSGGTAAYQYSWSNGNNQALLSNVNAGSYTVTVTDSHSCSATASTTVNTSQALQLVTNAVNILCNGSATGSASVSINAGTSPYTYSWSDGSSSATDNNIPAGTYSVTVSDAAGCSTTASQIVTQPTALNSGISTTNATCGATDGSATVTVSGGTSGYSYLWNTGGTSASISGLASGTYTVTITDANNCTITAASGVNNTSSMVATVSSTNELCNGGNSGSAGVSLTGGTSPFNYAWNTGATSSQLNNIAAGTYIVTITDAANCVQFDTVTVTEPSALSGTLTTTEPTCNGGQGSASISASGGTPGYSYQWTGGETNSSAILTAGNYSVTLTDANNCSSVQSFSIQEPAALNVSASVTNLKCFNDQTGSAQVTVNGGTGPYSYLWNNGQTSAADTALHSGNYTVTITDSHNCTTSTNVFVSQPDQIQITTSSTDATNGQNNGTASVVNIFSAVTPYTFAWSNGDTSQSISNLAPGTYFVTITDHNGCQKEASAQVQLSLGMQNISAALNFSIFPNPASTRVNVIFDRALEHASVAVKTVLGQTMLTKEFSGANYTLDIATLASGPYYLELTENGATGTKQLLIIR